MMKIATAALAALFAYAPAPAQSIATRSVPTGDLRLDRTGDVVRLDLRIAHTARALCGRTPDWDLEGRSDAARCQTAAIKSARPQRDRLVSQFQSSRLARR